MAVYVVKADIYFDGDDQTDAWAQGNAEWIVNNTKVLAQQTAIVGGLSAEERQSWAGAFRVEADGTLTAINAWHLAASGVLDGFPTPDGEPDPDPIEAPAWVQPTGAHDAYLLGARVTFNGQTWENTGSNANTWQPGIFGWVVV